MRSFLFLSLLAVLACAGTGDRRSDSAAADRSATAVASAPAPSPSAGPAAPVPSRGDGPLDPRLADPDSAIRRYLDGELFMSTAPPVFTDCPDDIGLEHEPMEAAAVSLRPIGHARMEVDSTSDGDPQRRVTYRVEARSVAIVDPSGADAAFQVIITPRTDTFEVTLEQSLTGPGQAPMNWTACLPMGKSSGDGPNVWSFIHANRLPDPGNSKVAWSPSDGSWARVVALADSARRRGP